MPDLKDLLPDPDTSRVDAAYTSVLDDLRRLLASLKHLYEAETHPSARREIAATGRHAEVLVEGITMARTFAHLEKRS